MTKALPASSADGMAPKNGAFVARIGPIPEGFVAWSVGVVALLALVYWIGTRSPIRRKGEG